MSVYVDHLVPCVVTPTWPYRESCHLIADSREELLSFGRRIGLQAFWLQENPIAHFDLTGRKRHLAVEEGAIEIDRKEMVRRLVEARR